MKEFAKVNKDPLAIEAEQQKKKELNLIGKVLVLPGLKCWEVDMSSKEVRTPDYKENIAILNNDLSISGKREVIVKENCKYVIAVNKKNALKKAFR